jgi:hypothetical protein
MSQRPGDLGSFLLAGHSMEEASRLSKEYQKKYGDKFAPPPPQDKKSEQGAPLPTNPNQPVSEVEGLFGVRMSKGQKWALVIGITLALYGVTIYVNKK